jgi:hypothetical protein
MKKLILFALLSLLIIPALAKAQLVCDETSYPFRLCQVVQEFTDVTAGNPTEAKLSFVYKGALWAPLVVRINISSEGYTFSQNDFVGYGLLTTKAINTPLSMNVALKCELPPIYFEQTGDNFASPLPTNFTFYCYNDSFYIVMPASNNNLTLTLIPNVALTPAQFNFTVELMTEIGIPIIEPLANITNGFGNLSINPPYEKLEFYFSEAQNLTVKTLVYDSIFYKKVPAERPFSLIFFDFRNSTSFNGSVEVRYYFDPELITSKGWDKNNIRFYRFDPSTNNWMLMNSGVTDNYVWVNLTRFSLYGVFTSFYYPPSPAVTYVSYPSTVYITNVTNVTQNITKPVEKVEKVVEKAVCGNGICEVGESCSICPSDCKCANGYECKEGICLPKAVCGNGICERGENNANCPEDCPAAPAPTGLGAITGAIVATVTNPVFAGIISLIIIAIVLTVLRFKVIKRYKK